MIGVPSEISISSDSGVTARIRIPVRIPASISIPVRTPESIRIPVSIPASNRGLRGIWVLSGITISPGFRALHGIDGWPIATSAFSPTTGIRC